MDTELSDDQLVLRETVRRFLEERAPLQPYVRSLLGDQRGTTPQVWRGLAELGLTGLLVPEQYGGAGAGLVDMGVVAEQLGRVVHPGPFLSSAVAAVSTVLAAGDDTDRQAWLPGLADGSVVGTLALLEPDARYAWRQPETRAEPAGDGTWLLTGTKSPVPDAVAADLLLVTATVEDDNFAVFAAEAGGGALEVAPFATTDPTRPHGTVVLAGTPARRLGGPGAEGVPLVASMERVLDRVVTVLVADGLGAASAALERSVDYAKQRIQFGRPIGSFQAVQHRLAEMLQVLELGRAGTWWALWAADHAEPAVAHQAASMAKAWASDGFPRIGASAIQVHGGIGFTWEDDIHLFYKRLLTLQHAHGDASEHLEELASLIL